MNIKELISKQNFTEQEAIFLIQEYIKVRTGKVVKINLLKGIDPINSDPNLIHLMAVAIKQDLVTAVSFARQWFLENNYEQQ